MRLEFLELEEGVEEVAHRQAQAAQAVRAEDDPLALLRCRRDLSPPRETNPNEVLAGQPTRLAEEINVVVMDLRTVLGAGMRRRGRDGGGRAHHEKTAAALDVA